MKTASVLFGLVTAACAASPPTSRPLCDTEGAPACGNIGQVGRTQAPSDITRVVALPRTAIETTEAAAIRILPTVNVLLRARVQEIPQPEPTRATLVDLGTRPRIATQRPRPRPPRVQAQPAPAPFPQSHVEPKLQVKAQQHTAASHPLARPLVDNREDVVCGNVMSKGGSRRVCRNASTQEVVSVEEGFE